MMGGPEHDNQHVAASAETRGRKAFSPEQIPAAGWRDILWRTYRRINDDQVTLVAAGATYYALLALVPALTALVSIYGLFADSASIRERISGLASMIPGGGMQVINDQLARLTQHGGTAGFALIVSVALAMWSVGSAVKTMFEAMNIAYREHEKRNFFVLSGVAMIFAFGGVIAALLQIGVAVILPGVLAFIGVGKYGWLVQAASYVALILVLLTGVAALYRWGPSRQKARWRWITPGALSAVAAIVVMSLLFSWYAANFGHYNKTYGSLGGLIGMLTWMWLSTTALIVGAELNAETERQTQRDSTIAGGAPIGARRANAADTLGPAAGAAKTNADNPNQVGALYRADAKRSATRQWRASDVIIALMAGLLLEAIERRRTQCGEAGLEPAGKLQSFKPSELARRKQ